MAGMKRTREEYDKAIAILSNRYDSKDDKEPALEAMRELRDSAFALEEALVNLTGKAEVLMKYYAGRIIFVSPANAVVSWNTEGEERITTELFLALQVARIAVAAIAPGAAQEGAAAPAPATPLHPHQSEEIMDKGDPEKFTGPSGGLPDAGNSTPGV